MKIRQLVYFWLLITKKILKKNFFELVGRKKSEKTVMTLTIDFLVNYISKYHVLYVFRKGKDKALKQKNKMGEFCFLSLVIVIMNIQ
jgi:hypothetical protein